MIRERTLVSLGLLVAATGASGQTGDAFDPFGPFRPPVMCQSPTLTLELTAVGVAIAYEFLDGNLPEATREMTVGFDSAGAPIMLTMLTFESAHSSSDSGRGFMVRFARGDEPAQGVTATFSGSGPPEERALTEPELVRAREFAGMLWARRCSPVRRD